MSESDAGELKIEAGEDTEVVLQLILAELDDATLSTIGVTRETAPAEGLASEPITTAVVLVSLGGAAIYAVTRGVEKYLENKRQADARRITLTAARISKEAGRQLVELENKHSDIIDGYGIPGMKAHDTSIRGLNLGGSARPDAGETAQG